MSHSPDLASADSMHPDRKTEQDGRWYLRSLITDDYAIQLVSERAPRGTLARDLKPRSS